MFFDSNLFRFWPVQVSAGQFVPLTKEILISRRCSCNSKIFLKRRWSHQFRVDSSVPLQDHLEFFGFLVRLSFGSFKFENPVLYPVDILEDLF